MVLSIETSHDDTCIAILDGSNIIINLKETQNHEKYGGVYPSHASCLHTLHLDRMMHSIDKLLLNRITKIAVTTGPGLYTSLITGVKYAQGLSINYGWKIIPVHHIEGHILTIGLSGIFPPYTALVISGGHTLIVDVQDIGKYKILGQTLDDAIGECIDKVGREIKLNYPYGPEMDKIASSGDKYRYNIPKPLFNSKNRNMSFSGQKTHVRNNKKEYIKNKEHFSASFFRSIVELFIKKLSDIKGKIVLCGGVAASKTMCSGLSEYFDIYVPPKELCTDNAAMIGWAAQQNILQQSGTRCAWQQSRYNIDMSIKPIWSIEKI